MCGITGVVWNVHDKAVDRNSLDRMTDVLRHRGPDGRGVHYQADGNSGGVGLGHRRLSIIDLASGAQPLANEDETIWITFNGEIYNYQELHAELAAKGHCFRTKSDTETIVHLYEEDGIHCLSRLRGMFALAIWDQRRQRLFLARDRMGQKPLVYHEEPGRLLFASEIKAILQAPGVSRVVDPIALDEYLTYGYVPHPRTMFAGIRKLPPAHYAVYERGHLRVNCYWSSEFSRDSTTDQAQMRESLDHELSEAVRLRLRSDVPLGAFLSGGVDSTIIVGLMQRHLARVNAARGSAKIAAKTYTIGFPVSQYDETEFAQIAADHLHAEHFQQIVQPEAINLLPVLAWHFDEPFGDSSAIPTHQLCKMTREHVTVALTGDGGDELFAGYGRYQTIHRLAAFDRLPKIVRQMIANQFWSRLPKVHGQSSLSSRLRFRMEILRQTPSRRYVNFVACFLDEQRRRLYSQDFAAELASADPAAFIVQAFQRSKSQEASAQAMDVDRTTYLPCDLLAKVDIMSMAHGLECRSPFLDHHVVELAASIAFRDLTAGPGPKSLLTTTYSDLIPPRLRRRPKMGFRIPLDDWFRRQHRQFVRDTLLCDKALSRGYFRRQAIEDLLAEHESGRWNHGDRIWSLLCLETWSRLYLDAAEPPFTPQTISVASERRQQHDHATASIPL